MVTAPLVVLAALAALLAGAAAQCSCPTPSTQQNFDAQSYLGLWYEMKTAARGYEQGGQCGTASYAWNADKTAIDVTNTNFVPAFSGQYSVKLIATPESLDEGKFKVSFPKDSPQASTLDSMYWVLGTDYKTYSVVYSCSVDSDTGLPSISMWVLARDPAQYNANTQKTVDDLIKANKLDKVALQEVEHNCPATTCKPCNAKENVDTAKLAGRWWELQHSLYADNTDNKSCPYAEFKVTDVGVTMDVDAKEYRLDGSIGSDLPKSLPGKWFDQSNKKAEFAIAVDGGDSNDRFCIIDTDYDNWAVLTVCVKAAKRSDIPPFLDITPTPGGGVFVLSRGHGLNATHQTAANKAVVTAGWVPSAMVVTPVTPCPASAFTKSAAAVAAPAALLLLAVVAHALRV